LTIVTKDADFHQRSFLLGPPPRVIWIRRGNCSTEEIIALLRQRRDSIGAFDRDSEAAFLVLA
jgi:predicted nuclease of predicted toxin-antitoxin system